MSEMREKKLAHRKSIMNQVSRTTGCLQFSDLQRNITCEEKHKLVRSFVAKPNGLSQLTKERLCILCRVSAIKYNSRLSKSQLVEHVTIEVLCRESMTNPNLLHCSTPRGPSSKRSRSEEVEKCRECRRGEVEQQAEWIYCERCRRWFHRECAEIWEDAEWLSYKQTDVTFICHYC